MESDHLILDPELPNLCATETLIRARPTQRQDGFALVVQS